MAKKPPYKPVNPGSYLGNQVIINLDRLLFNARQDSILLYDYEESDYDSALLVQVADDVLFARDTVGYQNFTNKSLRENGIGDMSIGKYVKSYVKKLFF